MEDKFIQLYNIYVHKYVQSGVLCPCFLKFGLRGIKISVWGDTWQLHRINNAFIPIG